MRNRIYLPRNVSTAALPHYSGSISSSQAMWTMTGLLSILWLWGLFLFGPVALEILVSSVATAFLADALAVAMIYPLSDFSGKYRENLADGSSILTAVFIALTLPVTVDPLLPPLATAFALLVVKWSFGGLGANWLNPALAGRVFVQLSWPAGFFARNWGNSLVPGLLSDIDGLSAASDLTALKTAMADGPGPQFSQPMQMLQRGFSSLDETVVTWLNDNLLIPIGTLLPDGYIDYLLGLRLGSIGETSIVLILFVSIFLFARGIISWQIPLSGFVVMSLLTWAFGATAMGADFFSGDMLFAVMSGGFMFGLFFMATDPVTTPYTTKGKLLFGAGYGLFAFLFREYSILPCGTAYAILIMNVFNPLIISISRRRPFGVHRDKRLEGGRDE